MKRIILLTLIAIGLAYSPSANALEPITDSSGNVIVDSTGYLSYEGFNIFLNYFRRISSIAGDNETLGVAFAQIAGATVPLSNATTDNVVPRKISSLRKFVNALKEIEYQDRAADIAGQVQESTDVIQFIAQIKDVTQAQKLIEAITVLRDVENSSLPYESELENEIRSTSPEITPLPTSTPMPTSTPTP